jgi:hypothetical protein
VGRRAKEKVGVDGAPASSVFVKKPQRIVALSLVMVLRLLVYRLAEHRLRDQLATTGQTLPNQVQKPTDRPTMCWVFQCFEGVDLLRIRHESDPPLAVVLRLTPFNALPSPSPRAAGALLRGILPIHQLTVQTVGERGRYDPWTGVMRTDA